MAAKSKTKRPFKLSVSVSEHERRMLDHLAIMNKMTVSALVRQWVRGKYHFDVRARKRAGLPPLRLTR